MDFVDRIGGFGKVRLTGAEQRMLDEIRDIALTKNYLEKKDPETERYKGLIRDLFPMFTLIPSEGLGVNYQDSYSLKYVPTSGSFWYQDLPEAPELRMGSRVSIGAESRAADLRVLMLPNASREGYLMSVVVGGCYQRSCIDDLVTKLGERETPAIRGVEEIKQKPPMNSEYGIVEVPQLRTVLKLYDRAAQLLDHVKDTIGVTFEELWILRRDMVKHENVALRELSRIKYRDILDGLTRQ